jgi:uncharacterized protein
MSDAAFLVMDLDFRGAPELGNKFLNAYLDASGDHEGLAVLPLYLAYRTLVRAMVAHLGASSAAHDAGQARARKHAEQARRYLSEPGRPGLVITHGVSGSGKSHHALVLASRDGFVHVRSDMERKRLVGLGAQQSSASATGGGIYDEAHDGATYERFAYCAEAALAAGLSTVVDATFLRRSDRWHFKDLAARHGAAFHILACHARDGDRVSEATVAVLDRQLTSMKLLGDDERVACAKPEDLHDARAPLGWLGRGRRT